MENKRRGERKIFKKGFAKEESGLSLSSYVLTCKPVEYRSDRNAFFILGGDPVTSTSSLHY